MFTILAKLLTKRKVTKSHVKLSLRSNQADVYVPCITDDEFGLSSAVDPFAKAMFFNLHRSQHTISYVQRR